ncbi:hypothetical protein Tco_1104013 [Tanacetum coccineum]
MPPTPDLSFTGLDEFVNKPVIENRKSNEEVSEIVRKNDDAPTIEEWVSDSEEENVSQPKTKKKIVKLSIAKIEFVKPKQQEKTARKTVKQAKKHRQNTHSPRGNQRNWNNMMSQRLGSNFEIFNKAFFVDRLKTTDVRMSCCFVSKQPGTRQEGFLEGWSCPGSCDQEDFKGSWTLELSRLSTWVKKGKFTKGKDKGFAGTSRISCWRSYLQPQLSQCEHTNEFYKLVGDLASIDTIISDEDHALLLLTSLPSYYDDFVETLLYGRDTLKLEDVLATLNYRELDMCVDIAKISRKRVYTSPSTLIGGDPRKNDTVDMKGAQGNKAYTLEVLTKETQPVTITDCHAGNPYELEIDLTAKSSSLIIEGMYRQDWKERAET